MTPYRTTEGDMIDAICKAHYGSEAMTEAVYDANPGLAARGPVLPKGLVILLPDAPAAPVRHPIRLWS
ncbi:tail protein X [Palleronia caenipelagi]|uniref:Phage tail protein n=1 Tax=Palleronia caenipelagi TaxID=2489174 RepID=A0A547PW95_9RHOB|nr:tail protein X [Palleronia caenipelagi]TRD18403.1 phage tail protein [Palleronia caenipelagi]